MTAETDYFCPSCWERENPWNYCACQLQWTSQRREHGHYAILTTWQNAEKNREKKAKSYNRTAYSIDQKGSTYLVEPYPPGHENGPIRMVRSFENPDKANEFAKQNKIEILMDGNQRTQMPKPFYKFVFFR